MVREMVRDEELHDVPVCTLFGVPRVVSCILALKGGKHKTCTQYFGGKQAVRMGYGLG
jgi:hypothetical protein